MNLTARERQALRRIEGGLTESDPDLVAKLATLCRLMSPVDSPPAERSRVGRRHVILSSLARWLPGSRRRRHPRTHSRWGSAVIALWLGVSCALIATAAVLSHATSGGPCNPLVVHCDTQTQVSPAQHSP